MPDVLVDRYDAFAGVVVNANGETEIVIAGGKNSAVQIDEVGILSFI